MPTGDSLSHVLLSGSDLPSFLASTPSVLVCMTGASIFCLSLGSVKQGACSIPQCYTVSRLPRQEGRDRQTPVGHWGSNLTRLLVSNKIRKLGFLRFHATLSRASTNSLLYPRNSASPTLRDSSVCSTCVLASRSRRVFRHRTRG